MKTIDPLEHGVEILEHVWITLPDGARLAARVWLPEGARERPAPAVFEYLPYRKRDLTRHRDDLTHGWLSAHGFACVRVDMRGSGESDGVIVDQYREQELQDGVDVIAWIAAQPWCSGKVGMMGISWGGFNSLQVAARRPPALAAIITVCSTDDLYGDNMHYMGGCLLTDNLFESSTMFSINSCPPDPQLVGDRWRQMWLERLEGSGLWLETWLRHQRRDAYWAHGSVCEDYGAIECPVLAVGGWADGFHNSVFRLLEHLEVPRYAIVGPWAHCYPHYGVPGPAVGFLQECVRWWKTWLGGDAEPYEEPALRAWMMDSAPPSTRYTERPGRWVTEPAWPSPRIERRSYPLAPSRIFRPDQDIQRPHRRLSVQSPLSLGKVAGKWLSSADGPELAHDQREEDGGALLFDTVPLAAPLEILGAPVVELEVSANQPVAMLCARLCDVRPDDKSTRVTYGLLNLTHRDSSASPTPLEPGRVYRVRIPLSVIGARFERGHRIRLALSTSYWPIAWPSPRPARVTVHTGPSSLVLPVRPPSLADPEVVFEPPAGGRGAARTRISPPERDCRIVRSLGDCSTRQDLIADEGVYRIDAIDLRIAEKMTSRFHHTYDDYASLRGEVLTERRFERGDWSVRTTTQTQLTATEDRFEVRGQLDAYEGEERVFTKRFHSDIERDLV